MVYSSYDETIEFQLSSGESHSMSEKIWFNLVKKYLKAGGFVTVFPGEPIKSGDCAIGTTKDGGFFISGQHDRWVIYLCGVTLDYLVNNYARQHGVLKVKLALDTLYRA